MCFRVFMSVYGCRSAVSFFGITALLSVVPLFGAASDARLADAAKKMDRAGVRALLRRRVDVNAPQIDGTTALHWATDRDDLETAELLVRAGANVKAANRYGVTPLSLACTNGTAAMVERLLKAGADPNTPLPGGETALMTAASAGNPDVVKLLLAHGANPNARETTRGQTALMWAAAENNPAVVRVLIEAGADVDARSHGPAALETPAEPTLAAGRDGSRSRKGRIDEFTPLVFAARS